MKKLLSILGVILIAGIILVRGWRKNDFRMGIITWDRVAILSISPGRGMINLLTVSPEVEVWLPGGMGWYPSNKIKKIFDNERDTELMKKMFYYNFGFMPEKIAFFADVGDWRGMDLIKYLGVVDWVRYLVEQEKWLYKTEVVSRSLSLEKETLDEILPRDFADNELQAEEIKITVVNSTEENGLGAFVADRLNWMGFNVVAVEGGENKTDGEIIINTLDKSLISKYTNLLAEIYSCSQKSNETLLKNEAVLYLGQNYVSMIKYNSYVRTF
jgi:hypothetical protein